MIIFFKQNLYFLNKFYKVCKDIMYISMTESFDLKSFNEEDEFLVAFGTIVQSWWQR